MRNEVNVLQRENGVRHGQSPMDLISSASKIALTGATGFLGSHLLKNEAFRGALAVGRKRPPQA